MAKVTSKLQVTIPKALAEKCGIEPGDDIDWSATGHAIRLVRRQPQARVDIQARLDLFDDATRRQREREKAGVFRPRASAERDWTREDLYDRGKPR